MPASTPFLGLYKPGGGSTGLITPDEVVDIDRLNTNSDLIDAFAKSYGPATERNHQLYGPAASLSSVSGMKFGDTYQESDGNKVLWKYDGTNWVTNEGGMYLIRPTSAVGGTVNADGSVSPSGQAKSLLVDGAISPRFKKYRIIANLILSQGDGPVFQWVKAGVVVSTSDYWGNAIGATAATAVGVVAYGGVTSISIATAPSSAHTLELGVSRADGAITAVGTCLSTGGTFGQRQLAFDYEGPTTPVTGLYISCGAATILASSRISVYGLA